MNVAAISLFMAAMMSASLSESRDEDDFIERNEDSLAPYANYDNVTTKSHRFIRSCIVEQHGSNAPHELHPVSQRQRLQFFRFQKELSMETSFPHSPWQSTPTKNTVQGHAVIVGRPMNTVSIVEPGGGGGRGEEARGEGGGGRTKTAADSDESDNGIGGSTSGNSGGSGGRDSGGGSASGGGGKVGRNDVVDVKSILPEVAEDFADLKTDETSGGRRGGAKSDAKIGAKSGAKSDAKSGAKGVVETGCAWHSRATVRATAATAECLFAVNAGFFDTRTGACHGHVVADGRRVQTGSADAQNVHFGITKDGDIFTGYLPADAPFEWDQLIGGVIWLVRKGQSFVEQSRQFECEDTQETGSLRRFVDVISARTAIGHNAEGDVVLVQVDGKTDKKGLNLHEFTALLISLGLINAINLDGGGSSTFVQNKMTNSFPSDTCSIPGIGSSVGVSVSCDRPVTTIVCVHERRCPHDCGQRGICVNHGAIRKCSCSEGWYGQSCELECPPGKYGRDCVYDCECQRGTTATTTTNVCDKKDGKCFCLAGFAGRRCEENCPYGWFGVGCSLPCSCGDDCPCHHVTGSCLWKPATSQRATIDKISAIDFLQNSSDDQSSFFEFDRAANCKAKLLVDALQLVSEDPSQYVFFLTTLCLVSVLCAVSLVVNLGLVCWRCQTSSKIRYSELNMVADSNSKVYDASDLKFCAEYEDGVDGVELSRNEMRNDWTDSSEANTI